MKNLNRPQNQATPDQVKSFNQGKRQQELEDYKKQHKQLWQDLEQANTQLEEASTQVEEFQKK